MNLVHDMMPRPDKLADGTLRLFRPVLCHRREIFVLFALLWLTRSGGATPGKVVR